MKKLASIVGVSLCVSVLCLSCGGGGSGGGGGVADLEGIWLGWIENDEGYVVEFGLEIDNAGNVIDVMINTVSTGDTGHINEDWDENLFHVLYEDGSLLSHGYMIVDDQYSHATYGDRGSVINSDYYLGVLEKGAANLPAHAVSDIVANYPVGGAYAYSDISGNFEGDNITMTVDPGLTFSGDSPEGLFSGVFEALFDTTHGRYAGSLTSTSMTMDITAYVSPDGEAVAAFAWEIDTVPASIEDFYLLGLKK